MTGRCARNSPPRLQVDGEFLAEQAGSVAEAEARLAATEQRLDALILDVSLPDGDGRDFCAELRRQGLRMPIIMLTGSDDEADVSCAAWKPAPTTTSPSRSA